MLQVLVDSVRGMMKRLAGNRIRRDGPDGMQWNPGEYVADTTSPRLREPVLRSLPTKLVSGIKWLLKKLLSLIALFICTTTLATAGYSLTTTSAFSDNYKIDTGAQVSDPGTIRVTATISGSNLVFAFSHSQGRSFAYQIAGGVYHDAYNTSYLVNSATASAGSMGVSVSIPLAAGNYKVLFQTKDASGRTISFYFNSAWFGVTQTAPSVSGFAPTSGTAGTTATVTVNGSNFPNTLITNIDGQATGCTRQSISGTQGIFSCPLSLAGARLFKVQTDTLANGGTVVYQGTFTVNAAVTSVSSFSPQSGTVGTTSTITVNGSNFPSTLIINIDGQSTGCARQSVSSAQGVFTCPLDLAGARLFKVQTDTLANGGTVIYQGTFTVNAQTAPSVAGFTPSSGTVGTTATVTVYGSNFPSTLIINIDGQFPLCTRQSGNSTQGVFSCPLSLAGARLFEVKTNTQANGGTVIYTGTFTVNAQTAPSVSGFTPSSGTVGTTATVTVSGSNFPSTLIINIDGQSTGCTRQSVSAAQGVFTCPLDLVGARLFKVQTDTLANGGTVFYTGTFTVNSATASGSTTLFSNGFETSAWSKVQVAGTGGDWSLQPSGTHPSGVNPHGGSSMAVFNSYTSTSGDQTRLYQTSGFAIPIGYTNATLTYWIYHDIGYSALDRIQLQVSTNGTTWSNVSVPVSRYNGNSGWEQISVDLSGYVGQGSVRLGFLGVSDYGNDIHIDDVLVTGGGAGATAATITSVIPAAARLDVLQTFTLAGTGFSGSTSYAVEDCTNETPNASYPVVSATSITFRCTPTLPGEKRVSANGVPVAGFTIAVDHPSRLGNASSRGIPSVNGVSLWNGNVHLEATDLAVPGKGVSFALTRSYNSYSWAYEAARGGVSNAAPWRFNWDLKLGYVAGTGNKQMWVQREDGSGENFFKDVDTLWYPMDQGNFNTIKVDMPVAGQTTLLTREGLKYVFQNPDLGGLLIKILDHDGNGLTVTRDGSGRVGTVTDASNRNYTFTYDTNGNMSRVTDFSGRYVEYTWDVGVSSVRIKTVRDVRGGITTYNYALYNSSLVPAQFLLTGIIDPLGNTARTFTYTDTVYGNWGASSVKDALNNMWIYNYCAKQSNGSCSTDPTGAGSFETTLTPPLGAATVARFDTAGRLKEYVDANAKASRTTPMPLAGLASKNYNLAALPTRQQSALGVTGNYGTNYTYTPDKAGNLYQQNDAENATTTRTWLADATLAAKNLHRVSQYYSATGGQHGFTYTGSGNVQSYTPPGLPATVLNYDTAGQVSSVTDGRNNTSRRYYDAYGNLTQESGPDSFSIQNTYDSLGRVQTTTDKRGNRTTNTYDAAGNLITVQDALNGMVSYVYDANGTRTRMTDANGNITRYTYDANNRLKTVEKVNGAQTLTTAYNYDALGRAISTVNANSHADSTTYDGEGNVLTRANALVHTTQYVYDADNRVIRTIDPEGRTTDTTYDKVGRVKSITTAAGTTSYAYDGDGRMTSSTDPRGKITGYTYDAAGRLTALTDANNQVTRATYDANGNMLTVNDPNGKTTTYTYDTLNRQLTRTDANGQQWVTTYDQNGNIKTSTVPGNKTTTYTYDALDRVSRIDYPDASVVSYTYDANGNRLTMTDSTGTTRYTYDALDRMTGKTDPQGKTVSYSYDGIGNVKTLGYPGGQAVSYSYDAGERVISLTDWLGKTTAYTLNRAGQVTAALFGNNSRADMAYDQAGRMTSLVNKDAAGAVISSHVMTLDANGNITGSTQQLPLQPSLSNVNRAFTYDPANRLATYNGAAVSHDAAGRIISLSGTAYSYNERDQVTAITGSQTASYAYNGEGHRVMRNINGAITRFVIDPNRGLPEVIAETDDAGTVLRNFVYGYGLVERIGSAGGTSYYHFDPTGSTLALTNAAGAVTDSYAYAPYGETTASGTTVNPFRYVGKLGVMDDGNGMQYMRARYYRPDVARFMSLDQLAGSASRPQSLNRYAYALGNPVMGVDPSGLSAWSVSKSWVNNFGAVLTSTGENLYNTLLAEPTQQTKNECGEVLAGADRMGTKYKVIGGTACAAAVTKNYGEALLNTVNPFTYVRAGTLALITTAVGNPNNSVNEKIIHNEKERVNKIISVAEIIRTFADLRGVYQNNKVISSRLKAMETNLKNASAGRKKNVTYMFKGEIAQKLLEDVGIALDMLHSYGFSEN